VVEDGYGPRELGHGISQAVAIELNKSSLHQQGASLLARVVDTIEGLAKRASHSGRQLKGIELTTVVEKTKWRRRENPFRGASVTPVQHCSSASVQRLGFRSHRVCRRSVGYIKRVNLLRLWARWNRAVILKRAPTGWTCQVNSLNGWCGVRLKLSKEGLISRIRGLLGLTNNECLPLALSLSTAQTRVAEPKVAGGDNK
jgi:hypothetical protein